MKLPILILIAYVLVTSLPASAQDRYAENRKEMVDRQLKERGITDKNTLHVLGTIPRHEFVHEDLIPAAYTDQALAIGNGQTISQPYIVALMTQELDLRPNDRVLEIGTGSGYQAAVLSKMVDSVYTIEIIEELARSATVRLKRLGYDNVVVRWGDGYHGWPSNSPFDAIIVTAGADSIPQPLIDQLKDGGRIVIPVGPTNLVRQLVKLTKKKGKILSKNLIPVRFVPFTRKSIRIDKNNK
ncbi:MAG: protein-L-isoaspartate(D-aspartate) O-methyltransferase [Maribacter sp.]|nr:protein-L-isoaspartate(D-aspartate) O-methyltransferase [Maribacter sp.]